MHVLHLQRSVLCLQWAEGLVAATGWSWLWHSTRTGQQVSPWHSARSAMPWPSAAHSRPGFFTGMAQQRAEEQLVGPEGNYYLPKATQNWEMGNGKGNIDILCFKKLQNLFAFYIFLRCLFLHLLFVRQWILPTATSLGNLIWCHTIKVKPACCAKSHANFSSKTETGDVGCTPLGCAKPQR